MYAVVMPTTCRVEKGLTHEIDRKIPSVFGTCNPVKVVIDIVLAVVIAFKTIIIFTSSIYPARKP